MKPKVNLMNKKNKFSLKRSPKRRSFSSSSKRQKVAYQEATLTPKERREQRLPNLQLRFKMNSINSSPQILMAGFSSISQEILHRLNFWRAPLPDIKPRVTLPSPKTSKTSKYGLSSLNHLTITTTKQMASLRHNHHYSMECLFSKPPKKKL